jgi:hypothetical protein
MEIKQSFILPVCAFYLINILKNYLRFFAAANVITFPEPQNIF